MKLMKIYKSLGYIGTALVLTLCLLWSPTLASANTFQKNIVSENVITLSSVSRYIEISAIYHGKLTVTPTIYYRSDGYAGMLNLLRTEKINDSYIEAYYGGIVTCEGTCLAPSSKSEEQ